MKKEKKAKRQKENNRRKWPVWLTVILTILGVGAVSGVTVLGVYLAGGFEERVINPSDVVFSYDEDLFNQQTNQLEVTEDFTLMIDSSTSFVTNDQVTLSFDLSANIGEGDEPQSLERRQVNGVWYISNGIIEMPETVRIRQPFTVTLRTQDLTDDDGSVIAEDWIKGGISTIIATSVYNQISSSQPLKIAVDVPVYDIEVYAVSSTGDETNQIVTGETFTLQTRFIPEASRYMYSDDKNNDISEDSRRIKHTYYVTNDSSVTTRYEDLYSVSFMAGEDTDDSVSLQGYVFRNADRQIETENLIETTSNVTFYTQMLSQLSQAGEETAPSGSTTISIGMASVERYTVSSQALSMNTNQSLRLYMNRYIYDESSSYLGVNIYSTSGPTIESMLRNIAIAFSYDGQDPTDNSFLEVSGGDIEVIDGVRYYKPFTDGINNLNYSYWTLRSSREAEITMTIVLLIENEEGGYSIFDLHQPYYVTLQVTTHEEEPLEWATDSDTIDVMLGYNSTGTIDSKTIDLESLISIPENNIYRDYVFFAWFGNGEKEDLRQTVDSVIGSAGYNYELSGMYATTENMLLFALNGTSITLLDSGSFRLYYATIITENGVPVYQTDSTGNRTYSIAVMSQDYIQINCEKELYQDSVSAGSVNTDNFTPLENGEYAINQGSQSTISFSFVIDSEALPVFTEEYNNGYMSLMFRDTQNNDVTSNFTILSQQLTNDGENGLLTYQVIVNTGVNISVENGIYLSQVILRYDDTVDSGIEWSMPINDRTICIYAPQAQNIEIDTTNIQSYLNFITGQEAIVVNQILNTAGNFDTTINVGDEVVNSVDALLTLLLGGQANDTQYGYVVITDQKGRVDTLAGNWRFALVEGSDANAINLNGQTFTFRQAEDATVRLALETIDGNQTSLSNGQSLYINVTSEGITYAESLTSEDPYPAGDYTDDMYESSDISNLYVSMYGVKGEERVTLSNLVKFYIGEGRDDQQYYNIRFTLSQQYLNDTRITDEMFISLYNSTDGMISLYDSAGQLIEGLPKDAQEIKSMLSGVELSAISFNKNFARSSHIIVFSITDTGSNGAITSSLNMTIRTAYTVTNVNYPEDNREPLYAHTDLELVNSVTNEYYRYLGRDDCVSDFETLFDGGELYYIQSSGSGYVLVNEIDENDTYIGTFDSSTGIINFNDFWDVENRDFAVTFTPEGENYFTLSLVIQFRVTRDLAIEDLNSTYYIVTGAGTTYNVDDFVDKYRLSAENQSDADRTNLQGLTLSYQFSDYFTVNSNGDITTLDGELFFFDFNEKQLFTNLTIYYVSQSGNIELETITIPIEIYSGSLQAEVEVEGYDIYEEISGLLTYQTSDSVVLEEPITAQVQNITSSQEDGSETTTEYIMVQEGTWNLDTTFVSGSGYSIYPSLLDSEGNSLDSYYDVFGNGEGDELSYITINFRNIRNRILQGLEEPIYLVLYFGSPDDSGMPSFPGTTAVMYVPLIISAMGFDYVNYQEDMVDDIDKLQTAIQDPNSYIVNGEYNGPYQTIRAGQISQILSQYDFTDNTQTTGLYLLGGQDLQASIDYYPLDSTGSLFTSEDIIKFTRIDSIEIEDVAETVGTISLNHLSSLYQDEFYFAVSYTLQSTSESREFYYVYKVEPDVIVEEPVYAYNTNSQGAVEYLQGEQNQEGQVDFNQIFGANTLVENQKRFNITKQFNIVSDDGEAVTGLYVDMESEQMQLWISVLNEGETIYELSSPYTIERPDNDENVLIDLATIFGEGVNIAEGNIINLSILSGNGDIYYNDMLIFSDLVETNEIEYVTVGEDTFYDEQGWGEFIEIYFTSDTSIMHYTPLTNEQITIRVKHSYNGSADENELSIIGGEQYYRFIVNSTTYNYSVRFTNGSETFTTNGSNQTYTWDDVDSEESDSIRIHLLQGVDAGSSGYEEVWDNLHIALTSETDIEGNLIDSENSALIAEDGYTYSSASSANGLFTLNFADYISSARILEFTLYTDQGYLATLLVYIDATASVSFINDETGELSGGDSHIFSEIFGIQLNGELIGRDNYTVTGEITSSTEYQDFSGQDFVVFDEDGTFIVANLLRDYQVTFRFTVEFNSGAGSEFENKTFIFTQQMLLKANVTHSSSVNGGQVIAGGEKTIENVFNSISDLNTKIVYTGTSSSQAFASVISDNIILTNYVANLTNMDVNLTVRIYFTYGESEVTIDTPYQQFNMTYSLSVYPSVDITISYPQPNDERLEQEYLDSNSTYTNILEDFILHSAIFSDNSRLSFAPAEYDDEGNVYYNYENLLNFEDNSQDVSILVYSLENATIYSDAGEEREYYLTSQYIPATANDIVFVRGSRNTSGDIVDSMGESLITLRITYQNVQVDYNISLLDNVLSVQINNVTNNTARGQLPSGTTVDYEISYIDQTNLSSSMFAKSRLAEVTFSPSLSRTGMYYLVFSDGEQYYASYPQYIETSRAGLTQNIDLGYSMTSANMEGETIVSYTDFDYVGVFLVTNFENNNLTISNNGLIVNSEDIAITDISSLGTNFDANNAIFESISLINRVQLVYGGTSNILVDYIYYEQYLNQLNLNEISSSDLDTISSAEVFGSNSFDKDDGSENSIVEFNVNYYYMPTIDVDIEEKISSVHNYVILETNQEYSSMVSEFGVHHPSTGQLVSVGDFGVDKANLSLSVIELGEISDESTTELLQEYLLENNEYEFKTTTESNRQYLRPSPRSNVGEYTYDYWLTPLGADNQGDLVLLKITYSVQLAGNGTASKDFYVVVKIIPDYIVSFGGNAVDFTEDDVEGDEITNINNIYNIDQVQDNGNYQSFRLTKSSSTDDGYVSVRHSNGDSAVQSAELATSNFTITMRVPSDVVGGVEYNQTDNVEQKLGDDLRTWDYQSGQYTLVDGNGTLFQNAKEVIFGTQYFMIEAEDDYGFRYVVYFSLQSSSEPNISSSGITLTEGSYFDIGAQYDLLRISTISENDSTQYAINNIPTSPISTDSNVTLITINGLQAHMYAQDPLGYQGVSLGENGGYTTTDSEIQSIWPRWNHYVELGYFEIPLINYVTIDSINFYDENDNSVAERIDLSAESYYLATNDMEDEDGTELFYFNGFGNARGVFTSDQASLIMPKLTDTDLYNESNTASVQMVIRLKYEYNNSVTEYYDLIVPITVVREVTVVSNNVAPVRDGVMFDVDNQFNITESGGNVEGDYSYINDTLEVLVNGNSTTNFQLYLIRDDEVVNQQPAIVSLTNGQTIARTNYISISQQFGRNIQEGDEIRIVPLDNNAEFYYITNEGASIVNNHYVPASDGQALRTDENGNYYLVRFGEENSDSETRIAIETIQYDAIYVEDSSLIDNSSSYYNVRKYYVLSMTGGYTYRISKNYYVTGYYYSLQRTEPGDIIMDYLTIHEENGIRYSDFNDWNEAFSMTIANADLEEEVISGSKSEYTMYLTFVIDSTTDPNASGNATIDENGRITYTSEFNENEYLRIVIRMKVSGVDRDISIDDATPLEMDILRLAARSQSN